MQEKIFKECVEKSERAGMPALWGFVLQSDFFTAPASTKYHLSVPGGLAVHSWNVYQALLQLNDIYRIMVPDESLVICGIWHDICKANFYATATRNVKNEKTGVWEKVPYITVADQDPLGHGEKSVIILSRFIQLTQDEAWAIRWHMGAWDAEGYGTRQALGSAIDKSPLLRLLMLADQTATWFIDSDIKTQKENK